MAVAPLQLPGYAAPQSLDFTSLANLGQVYKKAAAEQGLREAFAGGVPTDAAGLSQLGARVGEYNPQLGLSLAQLGMNAGQREQDRERQARQDAHQLEREKVTDANSAAYLRIAQSNAARANEDKPIIKEVTDPNTGATSFVRINPRTGELSPLGNPQPPSQPNNPFSAGGKFNEGQGKAAGFTDRMLQSEGILSGLNGDGGVQSQGTSAVQTALSAIPGAGNYLTSADRQKYEQAKRDFINAQLRRESGAAISPTEFDSANKQYFPTPGDSEAVISQKAANRRAAVESMGREGGPSYKPKFSFDEGGRVVPYGQPKASKSSGPISKAQYDALPSGSTFTAPDGSVRVKP